MTNLDWQDKAACAGLPPELFFPDKGARPIEAKKICDGCSVTQECLRYVLGFEDSSNRFGVWGGLSSNERETVFDGRLPRAGSRTHCNEGHLFTDENVVMAGTKRRCKTCLIGNLEPVEEVRTRCRNGHKMEGDNVVIRKGARSCVTCERKRTERRKQNRRYLEAKARRKVRVRT